MFDNLRDSDAEKQAFQEAMGLGGRSTVESKSPRRPSSGGLLGMSASQRLVIALLLMLSVVVIGTMCLLVTGRISAF